MCITFLPHFHLNAARVTDSICRSLQYSLRCFGTAKFEFLVQGLVDVVGMRFRV
jgi:hypothetical protein